MHVWDGSNIVLELNNAGAVINRYVRGINLIKNNDSYFLYNAHGDVVQLTNASGGVTKQYFYDAFGVEIGKDEDDPNPFRYCGEYWDEETETYYLRARYYHPRTGRFLTEDPSRDGLNWYTYCANSPTLYIDYTGRSAVLAALAIASVILLAGCGSGSSNTSSTSPPSLGGGTASRSGAGRRAMPTQSPSPSPTPSPSPISTNYLVTKSQLEQLGMSHISDDMVADLNSVLTKYGIETPNEIAMFLATCAHESKTSLVEVGVGNTYVVNGIDYRGAGFIQLTGSANYQAFADQMLKEGLVELDANGNNPIMIGGAQYIADNFAWESAAWFWTVSWNNCSGKIATGVDFYTISQIINGDPNGPTKNIVPNGMDDRNDFYNKAKVIFGIGG